MNDSERKKGKDKKERGKENEEKQKGAGIQTVGNSQPVVSVGCSHTEVGTEGLGSKGVYLQARKVLKKNSFTSELFGSFRGSPEITKQTF